jgi:DNA-directed RNA polymerase subunit beta'
MGQVMMVELKGDERGGAPYLNPIYCMADSGARGAIEQIRQLAGMRGLMAKPSGEIIETPIKANFREGLRVLEYFSSTHGARKGLADTALKTADSGYLTRKLADVAQNVVINEYDCGTLNGITKGVLYRGDKIEVSLAQAVRGRVARDTIVDVITDEIIVREGELITSEIAERIENLGYEKIRIRSPLTCESPLGICGKCYGMDLATGGEVELGMAVGIIAAHSIGEPGTQLTMRTFHWGGTAVAGQREHDIRAKFAGKVKYQNLQVVTNDEGQDVVLNRKGEILILDKRDREVDRHEVPAGSVMKFKEGEGVRKNQIICDWDPNNIPILAETDGRVRFEDIVEGKTVKQEIDRVSDVQRMVVMEHKGDLHPQVIIEDENGKPLGLYPVPEKAHIMVTEGQAIHAGKLIAKTPREITGTQDIVGGLPRVTELFEARRPKEPAVMSEIDGVVEIGEKRRGKRTIIVNNESGISREHLVPHGKHLWVKRGDKVRAGEPLTEGPLVPHDILRILDEESLQDYLLREIQNVYRSQGVSIDDKHIEIVLAQMLRKVRVEEAGKSEFLPDQIVDKFRFRAENKRLIEENLKPARARPVLLGITKAALKSDSFISAASFQETTKVLTEAALAGKRDELLGLKENVILGHLVPVGTGFKQHHRTRVKKNFDISELSGLTPEGLSPEDSALLDLTGLGLGEPEEEESPGAA